VVNRIFLCTTILLFFAACDKEKRRYQKCQGDWIITQYRHTDADTTFDLTEIGYSGGYSFDQTCDGSLGTCNGNRFLTEPDSLGGSTAETDFQYHFSSDGQEMEIEYDIAGFWTETEIWEVRELTKNLIVLEFENSDYSLKITLESE